MEQSGAQDRCGLALVAPPGLGRWATGLLGPEMKARRGHHLHLWTASYSAMQRWSQGLEDMRLPLVPLEMPAEHQQRAKSSRHLGQV